MSNVREFVSSTMFIKIRVIFIHLSNTFSYDNEEYNL